MKCLAYIVVLFAAVPASAGPFSADFDVAVTKMSEATALDPDEHGTDDTFSARRGSLDPDVVVELVRERLKEAGVKAAARLVEKLLDDDLRPWMRDLAGAIIDIATDREQSVKIAGEVVLRIGGRALLADAIVRMLPDAEDARVVSDWLYWRLTRLPLLAGSTARPPCEDGPGRATCDALAALDDDAAIAEIDDRTGLERVLKAVKIASHLQKNLAGTELTLRNVLDQITGLDPMATAEALGLDTTKIEAALNVIRRSQVAYEAITLRWDALHKALQEVQRAVTDCFRDAACAPGSTSFTKTVDRLRDLQQVLTSHVHLARPLADAVTALGFRGLADSVGPVLEALDGYRTVDLSKLDRAGLERLLLAHAPRDLVALVDSRKLPRLLEHAENLRKALGALASSMATGAKLGDLSLGSALDITAAAADAAGHLENLVDAAVNLQIAGIDRVVLADVAKGARRLAGWCRLLHSVASDVVSGRLGDVVDVLRTLGGGDSAPILDLFEPMFEEVMRSGRIEPRHLIAAFARATPQTLLAALRLPADRDEACKDEGSSTCWAFRLVLMAHGAVSVNGTTIEIHTEKVVDSLSRMAGSRRDQLGAAYLHLAVGTGVLVTDVDGFDKAKPLIAEQVGVGVKLAGDEDFAVRLAAYGSGLLYRFVLDSKESDGVMFGGALMFDLFGDVEIYGSTALLIAPGETEMDDSTVEWVGTIGVQVPLAAYLEKLAD